MAVEGGADADERAAFSSFTSSFFVILVSESKHLELSISQSIMETVFGPRGSAFVDRFS